MDKPLKIRVKEKMKELGIGIPELSEQTSIPSARIYKWYSKTKQASPKENDIDVLSNWLKIYKAPMEQVPREASTEPKHDVNDLLESRKSLEKALVNLSEDKIRSTAIIEKLVNLIEAKLGESSGLHLPTPGTKGTRTLTQQTEESND